MANQDPMPTDLPQGFIDPQETIKRLQNQIDRIESIALCVVISQAHEHRRMLESIVVICQEGKDGNVIAY